MNRQELAAGDVIQLLASRGGAGCDAVVQRIEREIITLKVSEALFHKGDPVRLLHVVQDDARYNLSAIVEQGGAPTLVVRAMSEWVRVQQREHVRLRLDARLSADLHADPVGKSVRAPIDLKARVLDLSAGGLQLETDGQLHIGDRVFVRFELPTGEPIATTGVIVRINRPPRVNTFRYGLRFINLAAALETLIMRFIYQRQAARRRKSLV